MPWRCQWNVLSETEKVTDGRTYTPVRVFLSLLAFGAGWLLVQGIAEAILLAPIFAAISKAVGEPVPVYPFTMLAGVCGGIWMGYRLPEFIAAMDRKSVPLSDRLAIDGKYWSPGRLGTGALMGALAIGATALLLWLVGGLRFEVASSGAMGSDTWAGVAIRLLVVLAPAALWEELLFRGFLYDIAAGAGGAVRARWVTSAAFAVSHLFNPGAGVRTTLVVMLAGWCLVLIREQLGLPAAWFAHLSWNWIMAAVLHVAVSGLPFSSPEYTAIPTGPTWLSGGAWGPEGGLVAAFVLAAGLVIRTQLSRNKS